jgi:hypothetical protein
MPAASMPMPAPAARVENRVRIFMA